MPSRESAPNSGVRIASRTRNPRTTSMSTALRGLLKELPASSFAVASTLLPAPRNDKQIVLHDCSAVLHDGGMLDVRRLRVLKTVVETGSVTAAAQELRFTPSAVSQQISALEREAGTALFEKSGRGVRPTAAGTLLAEHAGGVLARLEEAEQALVSLRAGQTGQLTMMVLPSALSGLLPEAVGQFRRRCPEVALDLRPGEADEAFAALRSGAADLIVAVQPGSAREVPDDGLSYVHLLDDHYKLVLPKHHRLAGRRTIELTDLAEDYWITTASCPGYCQLPVLEAWAAAGFTPRTGMDADDFPAAQGYV